MKKNKTMTRIAAFIAVYIITFFSSSIKPQPTRNLGQLQSDNYETIRKAFNNPDMIYAPFLY